MDLKTLAMGQLIRICVEFNKWSHVRVALLRLTRVMSRRIYDNQALTTSSEWTDATFWKTISISSLTRPLFPRLSRMKATLTDMGVFGACPGRYCGTDTALYTSMGSSVSDTCPIPGLLSCHIKLWQQFACARVRKFELWSRKMFY